MWKGVRQVGKVERLRGILRDLGPVDFHNLYPQYDEKEVHFSFEETPIGYCPPSKRLPSGVFVAYFDTTIDGECWCCGWRIELREILGCDDLSVLIQLMEFRRSSAIWILYERVRQEKGFGPDV